MTLTATSRLRLSWTEVAPVLAVALLVPTWGEDPTGLLLLLVGVSIVASVIAAVHHAEVIANRVGEPFGSLVLAIAVTIIEVGLIVSLMIASSSTTETLARDTVFAAVMITCNGVIGLSLIAGALRTRVVSFNAEGTATALATVLTLATLTLVLPRFTSSRPGPEFTPAQLAFAGTASFILYSLFLVVQTVRHRDMFLTDDVEARHERDARPTSRQVIRSAALLPLALIGVIGLSKVASDPSSAPLARLVHRRRPSVLRSPYWCLLPRPSPQSETHGGVASKPASTWRLARRLPALASQFRPSPSLRFGWRDVSFSA